MCWCKRSSGECSPMCPPTPKASEWRWAMSASTTTSGARRLAGAAVAPLVVVLADIAHLHSEAFGVGGHIGEHSPLERLHQHIGQFARDGGPGPVGVADGQTRGVKPGVDQALLRHGPVHLHGTA